MRQHPVDSPTADPFSLIGIGTDIEERTKRIEKFMRQRVSQHFLMRDFLYSSWAEARCELNYPMYPEYCLGVIREYAEKILEPVWEKFGPLAIMYGYSGHQRYEKGEVGEKSRSPHYWDRGMWDWEPYVRTDFCVYEVADGHADRDEVAFWMMMNLDVDLLMQFRRSTAYCVTIAPKPRRVWLEWVPHGAGDKGSNKIMKWGPYFWTVSYPVLDGQTKPKFGPSMSEGNMWHGKKQ